jgi:arylsulfatase A-like enzyme
MTGQYPLTNGVIINDVPLEPKGPTLGEAFKSAGYRTGYIGKWHLYGSPDGHYGRRAAYIPPDKRFGFDYWKANECDHNYNHERYYSDDDPTPRYWPGYAPVAATADACRFIEDRAKDPAPFFLVLSLAPPHFPYETAPKQYKDLFANKEIALRPNVPNNDVTKAIESLRGYYAHGAALDDCFKKLMGVLESQGLAEDTIVVFTSDHGDMLFSQGLEHKMFPWDESLRTPFLLRYPRKLGSTGRTHNNPMNVVDIMPTLLGLSGIPVPSSVQGHDFSPMLLAGKADGLPGSAYICNPVSTFQLLECGFDVWRGVRTTTHTYVRAIEGPWLLYDNVADPYQMHNLSNKPEARAIQQQLDQEVVTWRKKLDDKFQPGQVYLHEHGLTNYFETKSPIGHYSSPWNDWASTMA